MTSDNSIDYIDFIKDCLKYSAFFTVVYLIGYTFGFAAGRNHPSASAKDEWLSDVRKEVNLLVASFDDKEQGYLQDIELRDSIITALRREIRESDNIERPIKINVNAHEGE